MQTLQIGKDLHTNGYEKGKVTRVLHVARVLIRSTIRILKDENNDTYLAD